MLTTNLNDTNRIWALNNLGRNIQNSDTTLVLAQQAIALSIKIGFKKGEAEAFNNLGYWFNQKGNYPKALEYYLRSIQISESINFNAGLRRSFNSIPPFTCTSKIITPLFHMPERQGNFH